ncbi:hypothetical protein E3N88_01655 [Mikania micrantha]|uniref:Alcohol dehydrogenase-like C-terminal domain-containing protein n=1 Tax=Mikania micrantha TaxID=192012 RepID=A0A5N6Q1P7_9ASTR|nr:hypothetical protein E3N88_01655 [Mikania micrantha]
MAKSLESEHPIKAYGYAALTILPEIFSDHLLKKGYRGERREVKSSLLRNLSFRSSLCQERMGGDNLPTYPRFCANQILTYGVPNIDGTQSSEVLWVRQAWNQSGGGGLGGLGHVAVKMAKAFGAEVSVFSTTAAKKVEAIEGLKADHFIISKDEEQMKAAMGTLDGIIDTVSGNHPILGLLGTLKPNGSLLFLGKTVAGSAIGGLKETQEMLDFAAEHGITADVEL